MYCSYNQQYILQCVGRSKALHGVYTPDATYESQWSYTMDIWKLKLMLLLNVHIHYTNFCFSTITVIIVHSYTYYSASADQRRCMVPYIWHIYP